eukprot:s1206_g3.t1
MGTQTEGATEGQASIPSQLAYLVPSFDPSKDDLQLYQQKVQLVLEVWPSAKISELVTRLILNCTGSAFSKLQLHFNELKVNDAKSVKRLIELLGGHWGKTGLEKRFADAERALFQCNQQGDESHDSYLARADVLWTKLKAQELKIEDLQAYITLRGAQLSSEDKKRIILDSDNSLDGKLTISRVQEAVRMLGTSFFHEMTGQGRKAAKAKVYDQQAMVADDIDHDPEHEDPVNLAGHEDWHEDEFLEQMIQEGDHDAVFIADFESAASEVLQSDDDLATAYSSYIEARRKLSEKFRSRGFWPIGKGKSKFSKGRGKGKATWGNRKSLQQRILESNCRICGKRGHWKSECPSRQTSSATNSNTAAVTLSLGSAAASNDSAMPQEFLDLPVVPDPSAKDSHQAGQQVSDSDRVDSMQQQPVVNQGDLDKAELESIDHLTIADLKGEPVTFGKAHLGKTHEEVWLSSPDWTRWFLSHYHASKNLAHRKMIKYIQLKIQEAESNQGYTPNVTSAPKAKAKATAKSLGACPKSVAAPSQMPVIPNETTMVQDDLIDAMPWMPEDRQQEDIQNLQHRMTSIETALQQIVHLLARDHMNPETVELFPDVPEEDEWNNPWEQ